MAQQMYIVCIIVFPGVLIMPSSGPVLGLHDCPVMLPNTIAQFQHAWAGMSTQAAASSSTETKQG